MSGKRFLIFLLVMGALVGFGHLWTASRAQAGEWVDVSVPHAAPIPQEALRLRIIANSDSPADQDVKREVRDAVVTAAAHWLHGARSAEQARALLATHLTDVEQIAQTVLRQRGFTYGAQAEIGLVSFPTKIYGNRVYPAGRYEALRVVLGRGQGQNWWCVLYPPLCFIDIAEGDAVPNTAGFPDLPPLATVTVPGMDGQAHKVAVRVAAVDYGEAIWKGVRGWFARKGAGS